MNAWLLVAAINGFLAVAAGAFGAHGLEGRVSAGSLEIFQTGAHYHLTHALALGLCALVPRNGAAIRPARIASWLFLSGIVLFSGSLYFLGVTESYALVLVTPVGGVCFLAGWAFLAVAAYRIKP